MVSQQPCCTLCPLRFYVPPKFTRTALFETTGRWSGTASSCCVFTSHTHLNRFNGETQNLVACGVNKHSRFKKSVRDLFARQHSTTSAGCMSPLTVSVTLSIKRMLVAKCPSQNASSTLFSLDDTIARLAQVAYHLSHCPLHMSSSDSGKPSLSQNEYNTSFYLGAPIVQLAHVAYHLSHKTYTCNADKFDHLGT